MLCGGLEEWDGEREGRLEAEGIYVHIYLIDVQQKLT